MGISGPGLYRHFAGKDAMLAELLVGISERLLTGGRHRVAEAAGTPERVLVSLIDGHIDFALDDQALITLHDRELDRLREADRKLVRQVVAAPVRGAVGGCRRAIQPEVGEAEVRVAVHAVFGLLNSTPHLAALGREATEELLRRLAHGAFGALSA
ncbi:TetR family transcriptional regulator [Streptomyces avidinii]